MVSSATRPLTDGEIPDKYARNPRHTRWGSFRADIDSKLGAVPYRLGRGSDIEAAVESLSRDLTAAYEENCPLRKVQDPEILSDSDMEIMDGAVEWNPSNGYVAGYILGRLKIDSNCESCARLFSLVVTEKHLFVTFKEHDEEKRLKYASEDLINLIGLLDEKILPKNPERRKRWLSARGFEENHQFPKRVELCSKRFGENAFVYGSEGQKTLKRDAIPLISHSLFDPAVSTSSESFVSPEKQEDSDCSTISAISITCEGTPAKKSDLSPHTIKWPTEDEKGIIENHFNMNGFPNVIRAIDGTHIKIDKPQNDPDSYINRKGYYSVQMQAVCDHTYKILDVFIGYPGLVHDSRVYRNSPLKNTLQAKCGGYFILGDSGYPLETNLLTPYKDRGNLTARQINYNVKVSKNQYVIEQLFWDA
ncbi:unnamed protein product [Acanthoscelides obtectus]|uniref:DDE Tnp4 domain-containing protein n=1 Tax=Acanthoscelides obtectus TaxID=200917 RepID=A0A9P0LTH0_ACAOB|nr:unnamed protein product [Acanthoscelides obtectus]CAK1627172.1 Putative nuclease HARBI1 [Acanthoscelides obtectus]